MINIIIIIIIIINIIVIKINIIKIFILFASLFPHSENCRKAGKHSFLKQGNRLAFRDNTLAFPGNTFSGITKLLNLMYLNIILSKLLQDKQA